MKNKGFTLIELLVVIAVIGMLSSFVIVNLSGQKDKARIANGLQFNSSIYSALGSELVGAWTFDEGSDGVSAISISDSSGYGNNGTPFSSPVYQCASNETPSGRGCALQFDGVDDYVDLPITIMDGMEEAGTITMWVKADWSSLSNSQIRLISSDHSAGSTSEIRTYNSSYVSLIMGDGSSTISVSAFPDADSSKYDNQWVFIYYTWYESGESYYIQAGHNGQWLNVSDAVFNDFVMPDNNLWIGKWNNLYFPGLIDDVRIYGVALNLAEIQKHYVEGLESHQNLVTK